MGCAEVKGRLDCDDADGVNFSAKSRPESDAAETSEQTPETKATSPAVRTDKIIALKVDNCVDDVHKYTLNI